MSYPFMASENGAVTDMQKNWERGWLSEKKFIAPWKLSVFIIYSGSRVSAHR